MDSNRRNYLVPKLNPQEMKEKIKKIHDKYAAPCKFGITSSDFDLVSQEIEHLVNQEVERRIAERMPSDELIEEIQEKSLLEYENAPICEIDYYSGFEDGVKWLRSRLTPQVAPQVPYKTEGGGE